MPRETIYGSHVMPDSEEKSVVEVRWSGETGDMQIVTRLLTAGGEPYIDPGLREAFKANGIASRWYQPANVENPPYACLFSEGMYVELDRRGINDLIRQLRRARNAVFGADE